MTSVLANSQAVTESRKDSDYEKERLELLAMKHVSRTLSMPTNSASANSGVVSDSSSSDSSSSSSTSSSNKSKPSTQNNNSRPISSTFLDQLTITSNPLSTELNNDDGDSDENSNIITCGTGGNSDGNSDELEVLETSTKATSAKVQKKSSPSPKSSPRQQPKKNAKASTATRSRATSVSSSTAATAKTATTMSSVKRASRAMSLISDATGSPVATAKKSGSLTQKSSNSSLRRTDSSNSLANNDGTDKKSSVSQQKPRSMTLPGSKSSAKVSSAAEPEFSGGGKSSPPGRSNTSTPILRAKTLPGPPSTTAATKLNRRASAAASMRKSVVKSETSSIIAPQPTGRNASPTPSNFTITDMNLEDLDMDQLEKLFLNSVAGSTGNRSPSILSNYSSYVPWKPGIPIEPSDPLLVEDGSFSRNHGIRVPSSDTFTEPDEQFRAGLSLIQEAFNRKSTSSKREFEENKKKPTAAGRVGEKENGYQARIRELSDALAKEEAEKNALVISKNALLERYNKLWDEHRYCASKVAGKTTVGNRDSIVPVLHGGRVEIRNYLQTLEESERQTLLDEFLEACHPHDIHMQQATLDHYVKTTFDIIGTLPTELGTQILSQLCAEDLCKSRVVSKRWREMVNEPNLWKSKCLAATREDPEPLIYPSDPSQWETVYHGLHYREHNWAAGNVQSIKFLKGHTAPVTALKLKKSTLVTGSYDETVRIWDMKTGKCTKVLQGRAISCVDFLPELRIVTAGFNDQGRPHVWHMDSGEIIQILNGHNRGIRSISMNEKYVVTAGQDMSVIVWNWKDGTKLQTFRSIGNMLLGVQLIGEDKLVVVSIDGWIRTFSVDNKNELLKYKIPEANGIQWFNASGLDFVCATTRTIYQLRWQNKYVKTGRRTEKNQDEIIIKPELTQDPTIRHKIGSAAEIWCGTTDNRKQRVIVSTRFNSRTHNNKSIYVHTLERGMNKFAGLWERMSDHMATQSMGPMCMDVDHEKVVVGATGGMVYVMGFVGDRVDKVGNS